MLSGANLTSPRAELPLSGVPGSDKGGLLVGKYKLVTGTQAALLPGPHMPNGSSTPPTLACDPGCVFDVDSDPNEHVDLAASMPGLLQSLLAKREGYLATYFQVMLCCYSLLQCCYS
jgi:hypothetical protein